MNRNKEIKIIKNLINALVDYGVHFSLTDREIFETILEIGITKQDLIDCGVGYDGFAEYFEQSD